MSSKNETNVQSIGGNRVNAIQAWAERYAACDAESQKLNDERAVIRQEVEDFGLDRGAAFVEEVNLAKKSLRRKEGYKESKQEIHAAINQMDQMELWSHIVERDEQKKKEREEKKAAKENTGKAQADAYLEAHG